MTVAQQLSRESRSKRLQQRLQTPLWVTIDGTRHAAADWSLGGFGLRLADCPWRRGTVLDARLDFPVGSTELGFTVPCRLMHSAADRQGFHFVDLAVDQFDLLGQLWHGATTGRVVPLAAATSGAATAQAEPGDTQPAAPSWRRLAGYGLLLLIGVAVLGLLAVSFHARFLVVRANQAAVTVPVLRVAMPVDGRLRHELPPPGSTVASGAPLFALEDDGLAADIDLAEADLQRLAGDIAALHRRRLEVWGFFADYQNLAGSALRRSEAEHARARAEVTLAARELARFRDLAAQGYAARARLDEAEQREIQARHGLSAAEAAVEQAAANLRMSHQGRWFSGSRVEGSEPAKLNDDIRRAEAAHALQAQRLAGLYEKRDGRTVRSPCHCLVATLLAQPGEWRAAGTPVLLLRLAETPRLTVRVAQEQADLLAVGDAALLRLAGTTVIEQGAVISVSRLAVPDGRFGLPERPGDGRWATVEVALPATGNAPAPAGTPAQVLFTIPPRRLALAWLGW